MGLYPLGIKVGGCGFFAVMNITVNADEKVVSASTVGALVDELGLSRQRIAVEVNLVIVSKKDYDTHPVCEGDKVEIVNFVGGG